VKRAFERENDNGSVMQRKLFVEQDGARCHTSAVTIKWLDDNHPSHIKPKDWPPNSPDLPPIENLLSILSLGVYKDPETKNADQLKRRLQRASKSIAVGTLQRLIQSCRIVIKQKGDTVR
jgi:hypothetical protein